MYDWKNIVKDRSNDYRPLTFWSWNGKLENKRLKEQICELKEAGYGGFFMHARYGLKTEYLSDEWFDSVNYCVKEAKNHDMHAWCYDENGYPSGFAGMKLLRNKENLARYIVLLEEKIDDAKLLCSFYVVDNKPYFDVKLNDKNKIYYIYEKISECNVDVFNRNLVLEFIDLTHNAYYKEMGVNFENSIDGFFTDEPQYYRYGTPYSKYIVEKYECLFNEKLIYTLPYLFLELDEYKKYRWRYYKIANELYIESFIKTVYDWCKEHNCKLTGHTIEESKLFTQMWCCAGVMPFYEYEDIPGCDWLGRNIGNALNPKQVGSVAQQLGKKYTITESFACTGWDVNFKELKSIVDWQFANGINLLCTHLTPYSMDGGRKYDHPSHFSKVNPGFKNFSVFSQYVKNLGCMLGESKELANVGVIHPIHSAYLTYNRMDDDESIEELDKEFDHLLKKLKSYNIPYHLIDETLLKKYGKVDNDKIILGLCEYDIIVIPSMEQIDDTTAEILEEYVKNGGKLHLFGSIPQYVCGEKSNLDFLRNNVDFNKLISTTYYIDRFDTELASVYRTSPAGDILFIYNSSREPQSAIYTIKATGVAKFDLISEEVNPLYFETNKNGYIQIKIDLEANESIMILCGNYESIRKSVTNFSKLEIGEIKVRCIDDNILPIDMASYSLDGINFSEPMYIEAISDILLKRYYCGKVYLRYSVFAQSDINNIIIETEKMNCVGVKLNGEILYFEDAGIFDADFVSTKILSGIKEGKNNIDICIDYHQSKYIFDVVNNLSPESESLINCLSYETELAPICLYGRFNVTGQNGYIDKDAGIYCCDYPFSLSEKTELFTFNNTISVFPFYSGRIEYKFNVKVNEIKSCKLVLKSRFLSAEIKWNDYECELILSDSAIIPSEFVKENNFIIVTIQLSNRNRLGPHHWYASKEPISVWPSCFNMSGSWENGQSQLFNSEYSFVEHSFSVECYSI